MSQLDFLANASEKRAPRRVIEAIQSAYWAMIERDLVQLVAIATRQIDREALEPLIEATHARREEQRALMTERGRPLEGTFDVLVHDGIAMLPLFGPLFHRANLMTDVSGATSMEMAASDFATAVRSDAVRAIVLNLDTPGGQVGGTSEFAQMVFAAREVKPVVAFVSDVAGSAGYWIGSAAAHMVAVDTALVGSIGIKAVVGDDDLEPGQLAIVSSQSPHKTLNVHTKAGRERVQARVDDLAQVFVEAVAKHRNASPRTVLRDFGQGDVLVGDAARDAGMVDAIGTLDDVLADLADTKRPPSRAVASASVRNWWVPAPAAGTVTASIGTTNVSLIDAALERLTDRPTPRLPAPTAQLEPSPAPETAVPPKEHSVDQDPKATASAGASPPNPEDVAKQERKRIAALYALQADHTAIVTSDMVQTWSVGGTSVDAARAPVLQAIKVAQAADPDNVNTTIRVGPDREGLAPFASFGEKLLAIATAYKSGMRSIDKRLQYEAAIQGGNTLVPEEGGFFVTKDERNDLLDRMFTSGSLLSRVRRTPIGANANGMKRRLINETSRADGSRAGGVRGYWVGEGDTITASQPAYREAEWRLQKVAAVSYMTEEQLMDAMATEAVIRREVPDELQFTVEDAIYNGDGAAKPHGFMNSPALVTVAAETGQVAGELRAENFANMYARMPARSVTRSGWLINQEVLPTLLTAGITFGTGGQSVFMPAGFNGQPFNTILGQPVVTVEYAAAFNTTGDIVFVDLDRYELIEKGGIRTTSSIHVEFLTDQVAFRFTWRVDGQTIEHSPVTPKNAGAGFTISPFIALATRS